MRFDHLEDVRRAPASPRAPLSQEVVTTPGELAALSGEWRWLWARCGEGNVLLRPEWLLPRCRGSSLWVLTLRSEGRLVGLAPLFVRQEEGARVVRLLGEGLPDSLDVLMDRELAPHGGALLLQWLAQQHERWDVCVFEQLREGSHLLRTPAPAGWSERLETRERLTPTGACQREYRRSLWLTSATRQ